MSYYSYALYINQSGGMDYSCIRYIYMFLPVAFHDCAAIQVGQRREGVESDEDGARVRVHLPAQVAGVQVGQHSGLVQEGQVGHVLRVRGW